MKNFVPLEPVLFGRRSGNEAAAADVAGNQTFRFEQFVSRRYGGSIQSNLAGQFARGWKTGTLGKRSTLNQIFYLGVKLAV